MADNTVLNAGTGGDTIRDISKGGIKTQVVTLDVGGAGAETLLTGTVPVSGTVTANVGTTNGLALDATLTGGSAVAIAKGGAKGTTAAAVLTSNPIDANTQALHVDGSKVTQPVSGTFWQATQPVSGTVTANQGGTWTVQPGNTPNTTAWKVDGSAVTQPVSGTFWQATQPVSGTVTANVGTTNGLALDATLTGGTTKSIARGGAKGTTTAADITSNPIDANTQAMHVDGSKVTQPVSGTFWQATQPVSGTVTANQGGTWTVQPGNTANTTAWKVDGSAVTQPVSGTVTSNQGTANATPWNQNVSQVGGSAITLGQKASASSVPVVLASDGLGSSQATSIYVQRRILTTYTAVYRLAARPYALSNAFGAAGRKQYATIHHAATAVKTVKLKRVEVAFESSSAAGIIVADLVRITTAPATGNPAITPSPTNPGNAAAESTCLALPTTAATEGVLHSMIEWNMGITAAGSTVNPPPGLNWYTLWPQTQGASEADENQFPTIRPGILEGFAITIDASAALTAKGFVVIEFTEE